MDEWVVVATYYETEEKAKKAAGIIAITEGRLNSKPKGPQYSIETKVHETEQGWQLMWKKIFTGMATGCGGGCSSCGGESVKSKPGKVIPFPRRDN